jgi:hypothetical protein
MCGKWILAHICYAFGFAPRTGCDSYLFILLVLDVARHGLAFKIQTRLFCTFIDLYISITLEFVV